MNSPQLLIVTVFSSINHYLQGRWQVNPMWEGLGAVLMATPMLVMASTMAITFYPCFFGRLKYQQDKVELTEKSSTD